MYVQPVDNSRLLKTMFIIQAVLGSLTLFYRADYNMPLFAFAYILWDYPQTQKVRLIYIFIYSWIMVLIFILGLDLCLLLGYFVESKGQ
jgi:hypothetical protein